ncbi:hypothetical protein N0V91_004575 [Didymella pomorum]|uniref:Uncharacterized protein n=1 Tax=Didymella pomorum TaxID=749634 RepID=A0A9W9D7G3_9PLEO|nr:hypothetical protein N0V91_004575 [Didymella pomorum]
MRDQDLNHNICSLWDLHHGGEERGVNHDEKNFHYVNDLLQDRSCHNWKSDGSNHCKYTDAKRTSGFGTVQRKKSRLQKDWAKRDKLKTRAETYAKRWQM